MDVPRVGRIVSPDSVAAGGFTPGTILADRYRCACLPGADRPVPVTYCFCCGGHVKYHLQISLGRELDYDIRSTALSSGGKFPCTFSFRIKE
jgi:hypothetical protein